MGTRYEAGRNFEYRVKRALQRLGFTVIRSAGSKTPADLIAGRSGLVLLVQCTTSSSSKDKSDRENLLSMAREFHGIPVLAWKEKARGPLSWEVLSVKPN